MIQLRYVKENRDYQRILDKHYSGKVIPIDRYINEKAIINHYCFACCNEFYSRPSYLISIQKHDCTGKLATIEQPKGESITKRKLTDDDLALIVSLHEQGFSANKISKQIGISKDAVKYQLRKLKEKKK